MIKQNITLGKEPMIIRNFVLSLILLFFIGDLYSQQVAFPGAEGSGRFSTGGRGGAVYEVTNLDNSGAGSIVDALSTGNRTIVFRVSGTINLGSVILSPKSNTTIAGQTAPGDGICIKGRIHIESVSNVVIRYIRVRVDEGGANSSGDAIDIESGTNIIVDHVSASYARDEGISCQETSDKITVQWSIISEALTFENHSYGSLVRGDYGDEKTYHHNLYAHNNARNPRPGNYTAFGTDPEGLHFDFRNNVVYNYRGGSAGYNADKTSVSRYNFVGNAYVRGPESSGNTVFQEESVYAYGYFEDNMMAGDVPEDPWSLVYLRGFDAAQITDYKSRSYEVPMEPVTTTSPQQAKDDVLAMAGANLPKRDTIDKRIVRDVLDQTGHSIATTAEQPEGAWPALNSLPAPADTDQDGMPDDWEDAHFLNKNDPSDRNIVASNGYTMLEIYLNSIEFDYTVSNSQFWRANENDLRITWSDSYMDEEGFIIEKSLNGTDFTLLDSVENNISEYTDTNQSANPDLLYRIVAYRDSFVTPYPSAYIENSSIEIITPGNILVEDTVQLLVNLEPENSHNRVLNWDVRTEDLSKAIVNDFGELIALDTGMIQVTAETYDGLGLSHTISLHIDGKNSSSIPESLADSELLEIFPNPFSNRINIRFNEKVTQDALVSIYDITGTMMLQAIPDSEQFEMDTESLPRGMYLLTVRNNVNITNRVIVKN